MSRAQLTRQSAATEMHVVTMSEGDLDDVVYLEDVCGLSLWGREAYATELTRDDALMLVFRWKRSAPDERRIEGFIAARINADELHVNNIGVRPEARRQGIGGALLRVAIEEGKARGAKWAVLEVRASNSSAQALYGRFGLSVIGQRSGYYKNPVEDAIVMGGQL